MALKPLKPSKQARHSRKQEMKRLLESPRRSKERPRDLPERPTFKPLG